MHRTLQYHHGDDHQPYFTATQSQQYINYNAEQAFDHSCESYKQDDIEIGLLLSELELEMNLALKGTLK
jgi:hypothetical protein